MWTCKFWLFNTLVIRTKTANSDDCNKVVLKRIFNLYNVVIYSNQRTTTPQGVSPTVISLITVIASVSMTDTEFDRPFAT